ncbi:MAG TPA: hypothetical protein PLY93_08775 [Turneriella sp.]|nr:hypothetical protein [Turneriella sp.]
MEYVAFLFLGLGVLLVLAGVLLQMREKQGGTSSIRIDDFLRARSKTTKEEDMSKGNDPLPLNDAPVRTPSMPQSPIMSSTPQFPLGNNYAPQSVAQPAFATHAVPGHFQFVENPPPVSTPQVQQEKVAVSIQRNNPRLFEKFAFLYLDSSEKNVYDGASGAAAFDLSEVSGIRRFGRGVFAYDGFSFYFDHTSGQERFPLANLKTVGFYPNCVALTFRDNQPVALLFMEETDSIRKVLETFRTGG